MIREVNDDPALAALAAGLQAFVNLIPFNPIPYQDWRPSTPRRIRAFQKVLQAFERCSPRATGAGYRHGSCPNRS